MSLQVSAVPTSVQNSKTKVIRPSADYHPTIWGDYFLTCASEFKTIDTTTQQQFEELKQEVRGMLMAALDKPQQKLHLTDAVQRLGVAYHFEREIEGELEKINHDCYDDNDLYTVALRFRLLRQKGINVSCDIFNKFKDDEGNFKESLISDIPSMLSLYEAAFLGVHGENILDEALTFTATHLGSTLTHVSPVLEEQVIHALNRPIRKGLPRLEARHYISVYPRDELHNKTLIKFAKLDFNILQAQHQKELSSVIQWWKNLDFATKLPYARDRVVECYFWSMGVYFEPQYSLARRILTKVIAMASILDDTYDAQGTVEELKLLTDAIKRWDVSAIDVLPEYMKLVYQALLDVYGEIEEELAKEGRSYRVQYAKEAMKKLVQAYFNEAKWCNEGYVPTIEEYMNVALVSCGYPMVVTTSFLGMGEVASKEAFDWLSSDPKVIKALTVICRLMNDLVPHEFEQKRGDVASAVECYMTQHGASKEEVFKLFRKDVANAWKDINDEYLKPTSVPMLLLERILNLARAMDVMYKDDDGYTNAHLLKDCIASLLKDPCPYE